MKTLKTRFFNSIREILITLILFCEISSINAQKIVPNGGFETNTDWPRSISLDNNGGPGDEDQLQKCGTGWRNATQGTADYFHALNTTTCDPYAPRNAVSTILPNMFGEEILPAGQGNDAYAGIYIDGYNLVIGGNDRQIKEEYILRDIRPLIAGVPYRVSYKVSLAEGSQMAVNNFGAFFSKSTFTFADGTTGTYPVPTHTRLNVNPQILDPAIIMQTSGWYVVTQTFVAQDSYDHIVLGHFFRDDPSDRLPSRQDYPTCYTLFYSAYYYIDDVSVECLLPVPSAAFNYNPSGDELTCNIPVNFVSVDRSPIIIHHWTFGDGLTSAAQDPSHTYWNPGTYTVTHVAIGPCASSTLTSTVVVNSCEGICLQCSKSLVVNGDFSAAQCLTGYTSEVPYKNCQNIQTLNPTPPGSGGFTETSDASLWGNAWNGTHPQNKEHTGTTGSRALLLDAPVYANKKAWIQNVDVIGGQSYCFTAWFKNVCENCPLLPSVPEMRMLVNNDTIEKATITVQNGWRKVCGIYVAGQNSTVELAILALKNPVDNGNDVMIDDISFSAQIGPDASFTYDPPSCDRPLKLISTDRGENSLHQWFIDGNLGPDPDYTSLDPEIDFRDRPAGVLQIKHIVFNACGTTVKEIEINIPDCRPCCKDAKLLAVPVSTNPCCKEVYVLSAPCSVFSVNVEAPNVGPPINQSWPIVFPKSMGVFCNGSSVNNTVTLKFKSQKGEVICTKGKEIVCAPQATCCDNGLSAFLSSDNNPGDGCACRFNIIAGQMPNSTCEVYYVNIYNLAGGIPEPILLGDGPIVFGLSRKIGSICVLSQPANPPSIPIKVYIEFLDQSGHLLCGQVLTQECDFMGSHRASNKTPDMMPDNAEEQMNEQLNFICMPNPFTSETEFVYTLNKPTKVKLELYDGQGRMVETIENANRGPGNYKIKYTNKFLPKGLYVAKLTAGSIFRTIKVVLE